ncbi:MAG: hypothetical protein FWJ70_11665 [Micromonosporaceae bacterium]
MSGPAILYYTLGYWVYPYPPARPLRVALSRRSRGIEPTVAALDIPDRDVVASRATAIW